jgi:hypothetical protein
MLPWDAMGYSAHRVEIWQRERQITDVLEVFALVVRAVTAHAGITQSDLDRRTAPESWRLRRSGRDQRWRGALSPMVVELTA